MMGCVCLCDDGFVSLCVVDRKGKVEKDEKEEEDSCSLDRGEKRRKSNP